MAKVRRNKLNKSTKRPFNNYQLLKSSWGVQAKLFFEHSTLHGVRYIAENGRPFLERFMWFSCVGIGAVTTIVIIVSLWEKFQTNPTITGLDTDFHNWDVPFPAITLCQEIPSNETKIYDFIATLKNDTSFKIPFSLTVGDVAEFVQQLTRMSYDSLTDIVNHGAYNLAQNFSLGNEKLKPYIFQFMKTCEEIFEECQWKSSNFSCCDAFFPVFTESGFCYAFNSRHYERKIPWRDSDTPEFAMRYIKETDIKWSLKFSVKDTEVNIPIYILNSDEQAGIDVQPQHTWDFRVDAISFSVKQTYTTENTRQLSIKQRHCVFSDEIKLKIDHVYTYSACTRQCRMDTAMKLCSCIPLFYPEIDNYRHCDVKELRCLHTNVKVIKSLKQCDCRLGCSNTVYEVEKLKEGDTSALTNELEARFVSWPMVRYKREVLFGWVDLLVAFGGIAGLFLGFSLLSGVEIFYYFTIRAICMVIKDRNELEQIRYEATTRAPPDYDLSLVPYFVAERFPGSGMNEIAKSYYHRNVIKRNITVVAPAEKGKWNLNEYILPPFGIEFMN